MYGKLNVLEGEEGGGTRRVKVLIIFLSLTWGRAISLEDGLQGNTVPPPPPPSSPPPPLLLHYLAFSPLDIKTTGRITPSNDRVKAKSNLVRKREEGGGKEDRVKCRAEYLTPLFCFFNSSTGVLPGQDTHIIICGRMIYFCYNATISRISNVCMWWFDNQNVYSALQMSSKLTQLGIVQSAIYFGLFTRA